MRHIDVDQPLGYRAWPRMPGPGGRAGADEAPSPLVHALRNGLLVIGRLIDAGAVAAAGWLAPLSLGAEPAAAGTMAVAALLGVHLLQLAGGYRAEAVYGGRRQTTAALLLPALAVSLVLAIAEGGISPAALPWAGSAGVLVALARLAWGLVMARTERSTNTARRVLVVGDRRRALEVLGLIAGDPRRWAFPVGVLVDRDPPPRPLLGGFISSIDEAARVVHDEQVDDVIVALPWSDTGRVAECLEQLRPLAVDLHLFPDDPVPFGSGVSVLAGVPMARLAFRPLAGWRRVAKAVEDRLLGGLILLALAPLMLGVALAIKLDSPGPVLFRQKRYGYDNRPFTCFKFRSMHVRADEQVVRQATRDDPRVTRVGRFIRRTSLDELPQLFNVVGGSMSLVGPRPHAVSHHHHYAKLVDDYRCRHRMKPGITGWAQVNGYRGETSTVEMMRKRVIHDLWYIDHWSPWLDLKVLARTPLACLKGTNAY
jgi:Undecaprenyl-phosphate glucose phosphotransferase